LRRQGRLALTQHGWVEQQREVADDAARGPAGLQQHVDEGVADGPVAPQAQEIAAVGTALERDPDALQRLVVFEPGGAESVRRGDDGAEARGFFGVDLGQVDVGAQGLAQRGLDRDAPKSECLGVGRGKTQRGGNGEGHRTGLPMPAHHCR
jgi:hypothetical protein